MSEHLRESIEWVAQAIELFAVTVIVAFIVIGTVRWLAGGPHGIGPRYKAYRSTLGKSLLVGLELLVAADIIRTVTLDATLASIATLGALVVVRTALSWTVTVEVEGRWPWQAERPAPREAAIEPGPRDPGAAQ